MHREHEIPDDVPEAPIPTDLAAGDAVWLPRLLAALGLVASNSEGRRKILEGAVRLDGERVTDPATELAPAELEGRVLQVGPRRFVRIAREASRVEQGRPGARVDDPPGRP